MFAKCRRNEEMDLDPTTICPELQRFVVLFLKYLRPSKILYPKKFFQSLFVKECSNLKEGSASADRMLDVRSRMWIVSCLLRCFQYPIGAHREQLCAETAQTALIHKPESR